MWNTNPLLSYFCTLCSILLDPSPACSSSLLLLSFCWSEGKNPGRSGEFAAGDKGVCGFFIADGNGDARKNSQSPQSPGKAQENEKYIYFFFSPGNWTDWGTTKHEIPLGFHHSQTLPGSAFWYPRQRSSFLISHFSYLDTLCAANDSEKILSLWSLCLQLVWGKAEILTLKLIPCGNISGLKLITQNQAMNRC